MKSVVIVVEDAFEEELKEHLPSESAWVMPRRYDLFRSTVTCEYLRHIQSPETFSALQGVLESVNTTVFEERA